jgi:hypothetical protein
MGRNEFDDAEFLSYNMIMGRPRGSGKNTAMVNGRVTAEQMAWLLAKAEELGDNLSAALREALMDARLLELAREDYKRLREDHPDFQIPLDDDGSSRFLAIALEIKMFDSEDLRLRETGQ